MELSVTKDPKPLQDGTLPEPERRGILVVLYGRNAWKKIVLTPGQTVTIGRTDRAHVCLDDHALSGQHLSVWFSGKRAVVRDLESASGTAINGNRASSGVLEYGGFVVAGSTTLQLFLEGFTKVDRPATTDRLALIERVKAQLGACDGELYAVVDAARDERIRWMLCESVDHHQSLYEGDEGRVLDDVAPYLVRFSPDSDLLDRLLFGGWGESWGYFFRSAEHPKEVRRHLRRFLMVQDDETLERLYFRFYDPRALREFLGVATTRQREELIRGSRFVLFENEDGEPIVIEPARVPEVG